MLDLTVGSNRVLYFVDEFNVLGGVEILSYNMYEKKDICQSLSFFCKKVRKTTIKRHKMDTNKLVSILARLKHMNGT